MTTATEAGPRPVRTFEHWATARGAFLPDGRIVTAGMDRFLRLYQGDGTLDAEWLLSTEITNLVPSPDGKAVYLGDHAGYLRAWSLADGKERYRLRIHRYGVSGLAVSPDGRLVLTTDPSGLVVVWDAATGESLYPFSTQHKD